MQALCKDLSKGCEKMKIDFRGLAWLNTVSESMVPITEEEARLMMDYAVKQECRISQEKVKMIARNSGLTIFDNSET